MERVELPKTFEQLAADPVGTVYADRVKNDVRCVILRGSASLCAYVGVPLSHPLAGHSYNMINLRVHGGLTYSSKGTNEPLPDNLWWYGWDYGHCDDMCFYHLKDEYKSLSWERKAWTVAEVEAELWSATYEFSKLIQLAEVIFCRALGWRGGSAV